MWDAWTVPLSVLGSVPDWTSMWISARRSWSTFPAVASATTDASSLSASASMRDVLAVGLVAHDLDHVRC